MSYILEALKKSELEREQLAASVESEVIPVSADATLVSPPLTPNFMNKPSVISLLVIVIVALAFVYFSITNTTTSAPVTEPLFLSPNENKQLSVEHSMDKETPALQVLPVQVAAANSDVIKNVESIAQEAAISTQDVKAEGENIIEKIKIKEATKVISIEQANKSLLAQIPNILITSHIYSSQATRRSIVVNDERLAEGDFVAAEVQVQEITHQGMILSVNGSLLAVSRSRGWNR